jgi:CBS-domain-containing membrane protein
MNAGDIMSTNVVAVSPDTSVAALARLLLDNKISAVPVVDDDRRVVGIVSESDLLGRPSFRSLRAWWLRLFDEEALCLEDLAAAKQLQARDVMTRSVVSVSDEMPIDLMASLLHRRKVKRVPVLRDGKLVGIVSRADLLDAFVNSGVEKKVSEGSAAATE